MRASTQLVTQHSGGFGDDRNTDQYNTLLLLHNKLRSDIMRITEQLSKSVLRPSKEGPLLSATGSATSVGGPSLTPQARAALAQNLDQLVTDARHFAKMSEYLFAAMGATVTYGLTAVEEVNRQSADGSYVNGMGMGSFGPQNSDAAVTDFSFRGPGTLYTVASAGPGQPLAAAGVADETNGNMSRITNQTSNQNFMRNVNLAHRNNNTFAGESGYEQQQAQQLMDSQGRVAKYNDVYASQLETGESEADLRAKRLAARNYIGDDVAMSVEMDGANANPLDPANVAFDEYDHLGGDGSIGAPRKTVAQQRAEFEAKKMTFLADMDKAL